MSYNQYPAKTEINLSIRDATIGEGQTLVHEELNTPHGAPTAIDEFLRSCGWQFQMNDPTTQEPLYIKPDEPKTLHMSYRWYEAIAYEQWKFMTLADGGTTDA